ncbi:hypothetical protein HNP38_001341 [Chryseobacterium defluvii]|uniref:Uncharacterized protein n=1 Tax=Chryseobacterium defluvii TaxID=160396 RepID=A0A840K9P7_9FLAO|nr:hypothetical protein [Chryseobacterium defluvii]MBB4806069.1 hypothetical protein [Chryseobacterium defluvii]
MKKLFIIGAVTIGTIVSAFPFRSSCGLVLQISDSFAANATSETLISTLKQLNFNACGTFPSGITIYTSPK